MGEVLDSPEGGLLGGLGEGGIAGSGVEGPEVEEGELALESGCAQFVHDDVLAVELNAADSVLEVGVPNEHLVLEVEELDVSIVIARSHHSLLTVVRIPKTALTHKYLTVQQSGNTSEPSAGSSEITGVFWRGSHIRTDPSLPPLTISQGPYP